jgi:hypothetical protein
MTMKLRCFRRLNVMRKVLTVFLPLLVATSALGFQGTSEWVKFTPEDGRVSILLPGEPTEQKGTGQDSKGGPYTTRLFTVRAGDEIYILGWVDYDPAFNFGVKAELEANRDNFIEATKAKLVTTAPITLGDYPGLEFTAETQGKFIKSRVFIIGRRPYQLIAVTPMGQDHSQNINKFLSSFRVTSAK